MPPRGAGGVPGDRGPTSKVRIIGGQWKRSKLAVLDAAGLRPTPDRVRETLYNWLGQDLEGWRCLDAFAGSGALGFEAASRGAAEVLMVERDLRCARVLEAAKERLGAAAVRIVAGDAIAVMKRTTDARFELVLVDPPFDSSFGAPALAEAARIVAAHGYVYYECGAALEDASAEALGLAVHRRGRAGAVHFHLLRRRADALATLRAPEPREGQP